MEQEQLNRQNAIGNLKCYEGADDRLRQRVIKAEVQAESTPVGSSRWSKGSQWKRSERRIHTVSEIRDRGPCI